jgi:hypothetical protein
MREGDSFWSRRCTRLPFAIERVQTLLELLPLRIDQRSVVVGEAVPESLGR